MLQDAYAALTDEHIAIIRSRLTKTDANGCCVLADSSHGRTQIRINGNKYRLFAHQALWAFAHKGERSTVVYRTCNTKLCCSVEHLTPALTDNARHKRWRDNNRSHVRAYALEQAKRRRTDPKTRPDILQKERVKDRKRYATNPKRKESVKLRAKLWDLANPEKRIECNAVSAENRRVAMSGGRVTRVEWRQLKEFYDHRCAYCGQKKRLTMDHMIPLSRGGPHCIENIAPACSKCNGSKHAKGVLAMVNMDYRH